MPPPPVHDDVTMVMSGPVGTDCLVAWLIVATGPNRGQDYRLPGGTVRIGVDPGCDVCLAGDTYISGCHAEISFRQGQYVVRDLASTNGTYVNEARVSDQILRDDDRLRFGVTQLVFKSFSL
jgi:pSer/pThr/pTyr-binding forkhead associated (FHA) protein